MDNDAMQARRCFNALRSIARLISTGKEQTMHTLGIKSAWMFSAAFLSATLFGFFANPLIGSEGIFVTNGAHDLVHLATAAGLGFAAHRGNRAAVNVLLGLGIVYQITGFTGSFETGFNSQGMLLGFIHINDMGNYLHLGVGMALLIVGYAAKIIDDAPCIEAERPLPVSR